MTTITTGFLDGNLWEGADPGEYAIAVEDRIASLYPDAEINVIHQPGSGSIPTTYETRALDDDGNEDEPARYAIDEAISVLDEDICSDSLHPVWTAATQ